MQTFFFIILFSFSQSFAVGVEKKETIDAEKVEKAEKIEKTEKEKTDKPENAENPDEIKKEVKAETANYSGEIFVIRNVGRTEVFFRNHNQSYVIPKGNKHNAILKDLQKKQKLNQMASIDFNPKTKEITEVKSATPKKEDHSREKSSDNNSSESNSEKTSSK
ncbi:MAG: hypothetical protein AABY64_00015 [Bdellovibrionota bacterium]